MELLNVKDLTLSFCENGERQQVVEHVSFGVQQGEILGIVGESGSGKSMVVHCIMGLRKRDQVIDSGSVTFDGKELFSLTGGGEAGAAGAGYEYRVSGTHDFSQSGDEDWPSGGGKPVHSPEGTVGSGAEGESHPGHEGCGASQCGGTVSLLSS